jgi:hypothetical protein
MYSTGSYSPSPYHVRYLATLALGSSNLDLPFSKRFQRLRSTLSGHHFSAKMKVTILEPKWAKPFGLGSTHFNSGSSFPDPDQLPCCTINRCLFVEIQLLRNQILLCQHVFYYNGFCSKNKYVDTMAQHYKTFYRSNLLPLHGHTIFLCYKAT